MACVYKRKKVMLINVINAELILYTVFNSCYGLNTGFIQNRKFSDKRKE